MNELLLSSPVRSVIEQTGYEDTRSLSFLHYLVLLLKPHRVLELGTGFGCSTVFMAVALQPDGMIYTVDDYRGDTASCPDQVKKNLLDCDVDVVVRLIEGNTMIREDYMAGGCVDKMFQLVFMDASHISVDFLRAEHEAMKPFLDDEHVIVLDDLDESAVLNFALELKGYWKRYNPFHKGMAILCTNEEKCSLVNEAIRCVDG